MRSGPSRAFLASLTPSGDDSDHVTALTMTADQCRDRTERDRLIVQTVSALAPDAVVWVEVPGRWRSIVMSALRARGLTVGAVSVRRVRGAGQAQFTLTPRALRFALDRGHLSPRWRLIVAALQWVPFGRPLLTRSLPGVGFAAYRPGIRPFAWLTERLPNEEEVDVAVITNWRGERAPYLVVALCSDQTLVAKRGDARCQTQIEHEAAMLNELALGLESCGLAVPRLIDIQTTPTLSTLIESEVPGRPMASVIREGHHRGLGKIADRLAEWLACWNSKTVQHVELTSQLAEKLILSAARPLVSSIDRGAAYMAWLSSQTAKLIGAKVPFVAAHNDLTMSNVLGDADGIRSVVDWEAASLHGLPLADFRYAVCDAAAAIDKCDRVTAFRACFMEGGEHRAHLEQSEAELRKIVGGSPGWLDLCFHAGWLGHAANEQARRSSSRFDASFLAIANLLADSAVDH